MEKWDEYNLVEKPALEDFEKLGWEVHDDNVLDSDDDHPDNRKNLKDVILEDRLREAIKRINPWINENNLNKAVRKIKHVEATSHMQANKKIHRRLVRHISLEQDRGKGKKHQTVKYIDYENVENNDFLALNQFRVSGSEETIKPDIVLFVNGIPLGVIECKSSTLTEPRPKAIDQMMRYQNQRGGEKEGSEKLFRYNQFSVVTWGEGVEAGTYKTPPSQFKAWKDPYPAKEKDLKEIFDKERIDPQDILIYSLFDKSRLLDMLQNFTVFREKGQGIVKMVARYQQYRAVEKSLERIKKRDKTETEGGVVWHTQGSGKSLTMLFLGLKLRRIKDNPTLLLVTDRQNLDKQIHNTFKQCGFPNPKRAKSIEDLKQRLRDSAGETITTLVHKFQEKEDEDRGDFPVLSENKDIYIMVDEAHRTQYKFLAHNMRKSLPNAFYIGFTGTPIEKKKRNTKKTFGNYIDTYTIDQSIRDGTTLEIKYQGRLADIHLDGADLDTIVDRVFSDKTEEEKKEIRKRYVREQDLAEAPKRIEEICLDLIDHYEKKIDYPFKGMIVTVSKRAAVNYKKKLDELNGPESAVIISKGHNDPEDVKNYTPNETKKENLKERFDDPNDDLKFLIVCDMLLTGFDEPLAQVMYLDKPLKEHTLLQAIARVNRPMPEKNYGLIVDYYGISDELSRSLQKFSTKDVKNAMTSIEEEMPKLESAYNRVMSFFDGVDKDDLEACVDILEDETTRIKFNKAFKKFSREMDIVLPNKKASPYIDDLRRLGKIYAKAKNRYADDSMNLTGCGRKIKQIICEHISSSGIDIINPEPVSITDRGKFEEELGETDSLKRKATIMEHRINKEINDSYDKNPIFYESLKKRVKELIKKYREKRLAEKDLIEDYWEIIKDIRSRQEEASEKGLENTTELAFYDTLNYAFREESDENVLKQSSNIPDEGMILDMTKNIVSIIQDRLVVDWKNKVKVQKEMRKKIKLYLYGKYFDIKKKELDSLVNRIIELARRYF